MDPRRLLDQSTSRFQTVKDGLPELVKNSKDQYGRLGIVQKEQRQIIVLGHSQRKLLAVVDFAGARADSFDQWQEWSKDTAPPPALSADIEAGNGNGGKSFMVRGATLSASIESISQGMRTKMVFNNADPSLRYMAGYEREAGVPIRELPNEDASAHLQTVLKQFALDLDDLPTGCLQMVVERQSYTAVILDGVRGWSGSRARQIMRQAPNELAGHPQAERTLATCDVWFILDRLSSDEPIKREVPKPYEGFEVLRPIPLPLRLEDDITGESVSTGAKDATRHVLSLGTSAQNLKTARKLETNSLRVRNERNVAGRWAMTELVQGPMALHLLGDVFVPAITEQDLVGFDRMHFADTPLVRAVQRWVSEQVSELAERLEDAHGRRNKPEDEERVTEIFSEMREKMRPFLEEGPLDGDGKGPGGPKPVPPSPRPRGKRVDRIQLESDDAAIAVAMGTTVPIAIRSFETQDSGQEWTVVNPPGLTIISDPPDAATLVDGDRLQMLQPGVFVVRVIQQDSGVESNEILVESFEASGVTIRNEGGNLKRGERKKIRTSFVTKEGTKEDLLLDAEFNDEKLGRIGRTGMFTAGNDQGSGVLTVRFGISPEQAAATMLEVGPEIAVRDDATGSEIPYILRCGEPAQGTEGLPQDERTLYEDANNPTINEDPRFPNVVWINLASEECEAVRRSRGGYVGLTSKTFAQFLALKCYEVVSRLRMRQNAGEEVELTLTEFVNELARAQTQCAAFVPIAYEVAGQMT